MDTQTEKTFRTSDLHLIAFLMTQDCKVERLDKSATRTFFYFLDLPRCEQLHKDFINGNDQVSARAYSGAIRNAKDLINAQKRAA